MSACNLSPTRSWPYLTGTDCLIARRSPLSRSVQPNHSRVSTRVLSEKPAGSPSGEGREAGGTMGSTRKLLAGVRCRWHTASRPRKPPCPVHPISHPHTADWTRSAPLAIQDASVGRLPGPGPQYSRLIHTNGLAHSPGHLGLVTAITVANCGRPHRQSARMRKLNLFP